MPWKTILDLLRRGGPSLLKHLPKLWPLLMDPKTREAMVRVATDLASRSPDRRLRGRIEGTIRVADGVARDAQDDVEAARARQWSRRASHLSRQLEIPVEGRHARADRRSRVNRELESLQAEMAEYLDCPDAE